MSTQNWQAPIHFDLDAILATDKAKKAASNKTPSHIAKKTKTEIKISANKGIKTAVTQVKTPTQIAAPKPEKTVIKTTVQKTNTVKEKIAPVLKANMAAIPQLETIAITDVQVRYQTPLTLSTEQLTAIELNKADSTATSAKNSYQKPIRFDSQNLLKSTQTALQTGKKTPRHLGKSSWKQTKKILDKLPAENLPIWRWLAACLISFIILLSIVDAIIFIDTWLSQSWLIGGIFSLLLLSIFALTTYLSYRMWQEISQLQLLGQWQKQGKSYQTGQSYGHALIHLTHVSQLYKNREDMQTPLEKFYRSANSSHTDADICHLYSQQVLNPLDEQAYQLVSRHSGQTALLVMLSPMPLLSSVLTLWRNLTLIRDIAKLYGGRSSFITSGRLFTSVLYNLIYADVSEMVADSMSTAVGGGVLAIFSAQMAQGLGSGMMTARVGIQAMNLCRPLNFEADKRPSLSAVRQQTVNLLKQKLTQSTPAAVSA